MKVVFFNRATGTKLFELPLTEDQTEALTETLDDAEGVNSGGDAEISEVCIVTLEEED